MRSRVSESTARIHLRRETVDSNSLLTYKFPTTNENGSYLHEVSGSEPGLIESMWLWHISQPENRGVGIKRVSHMRPAKIHPKRYFQIQRESSFLLLLKSLWIPTHPPLPKKPKAEITGLPPPKYKKSMVETLALVVFWGLNLQVLRSWQGRDLIFLCSVQTTSLRLGIPA